MSIFRWLWFAALAGMMLPAGAADLTGKELVEARKIAVRKCAKCHKFYAPGDYNQAEWDVWMGKMVVKSKLKEPQADLVRRYLATLRTPSK